MTTTSGTSSPEYNVNREPAVQCLNTEEHDSFECTDPAHRIAAMYQTHDRVNVEIYNDDCEVVKVLPLLKEEDALAEMTDWLTIERNRGVPHDGPTIRLSL